MRAEGAGEPLRLEVPEPERAVVAAAEGVQAVAAERGAGDGRLVAGERAGGRALRVPEAERVVLAAADDPRAVGAEGHAVDETRVPLERLQQLPAAGRPDLQR